MFTKLPADVVVGGKSTVILISQMILINVYESTRSWRSWRRCRCDWSALDSSASKQRCRLSCSSRSLWFVPVRARLCTL